MKRPVISPDALCAKDAVICGDVRIEPEAGIWFHAVIRAEAAPVTIGARSNIQDHCVLHVSEGYPLTIGSGVTVGHGAILHGCTIGDDSLIGMGAIVLNGASIGKGCIIGAGSLVTQGTVIPDGMMAFGSPAKIRRPLTPQELEENLDSAREYAQKALAYEAEGFMERRVKPET